MTNLYPADAMLGLRHGRHGLGLRASMIWIKDLTRTTR